MAEEVTKILSSDRIMTYKEHIIYRLNAWRENLIACTDDYHEALNRFNENPRSMINTQRGPVSISQICNDRIQMVIQARSHVQTLERMLDDEEGGTLATLWDDASLSGPDETKLAVQVKSEGVEEVEEFPLIDPSLARVADDE